MNSTIVNKLMNTLIRKPTILEYLVGFIVLMIVFYQLIDNPTPINITIAILLFVYSIKMFIVQISLITAHYLMGNEIMSNNDNYRNGYINNTKNHNVVENQNNTSNNHSKKAYSIKDISGIFTRFIVVFIRYFTHYLPPQLFTENNYTQKNLLKQQRLNRTNNADR